MPLRYIYDNTKKSSNCNGFTVLSSAFALVLAVKNGQNQQRKNSDEELTIVRGTHEAIVSREQFDAVQEILEQTAQKSKEKKITPYSPNLLKGKAFCGCCGGSLHRQRATRKTTADVYWFHCLARSRIQKDACPGVMLQETELLDTLAGLLTTELNTVLGGYALSLEEPSQEETLLSDLLEKLTSRRQEIDRQRGLIRGLYENLVKGILTKEEYFTFKGLNPSGSFFSVSNLTQGIPEISGTWGKELKPLPLHPVKDELWTHIAYEEGRGAVPRPVYLSREWIDNL